MQCADWVKTVGLSPPSCEPLQNFSYDVRQGEYAWCAAYVYVSTLARACVGVCIHTLCVDQSCCSGFEVVSERCGEVNLDVQDSAQVSIIERFRMDECDILISFATSCAAAITHRWCVMPPWKTLI